MKDKHEAENNCPEERPYNLQLQDEIDYVTLGHHLRNVRKAHPYVATNMADYGAEVDYSASITGTGTFRIGFTVYADGYIISRYSNSRTF